MAKKKKPAQKQEKRKPGRPPGDIPKEKITLYLPSKITGKLRDFAYWNHKTISAAASEILIRFLIGKKIKPKPEPLDMGDDLSKL